MAKCNQLTSLPFKGLIQFSSQSLSLATYFVVSSGSESTQELYGDTSAQGHLRSVA